MSSTLHSPPVMAGTRLVLQNASPATRLAVRSFTLATRQHAELQQTFDKDDIPRSFDLTEMPSLAHADLETHQELRAMARLAAWEMPLLTALSKPFEPPTEATPLRWRYTTYFGELHPAANKVVVEFGVSDLKHLTETQRTTLRKLAGPRRDPETDIIKMSCESFPNQAQNKRYLGETIANLINEAIKGKDKFEDVPLDDRHAVRRSKRRHRVYPVSRFPKEWYLTPERRAYLDAKHGVQAQQIEAPIALDEQSAIAALKQVAVEAGEISEDSVQKEAIPVELSSTSSPARPLVSGLKAIEAFREQMEKNRVAEPCELPRSAPVNRRFKR